MKNDEKDLWIPSVVHRHTRADTMTDTIFRLKIKCNPVALQRDTLNFPGAYLGKNFQKALYAVFELKKDSDLMDFAEYF